MSEILFKELRIEHIFNPRLKHSYITIKPAHEADNAQIAKITIKTPKVSQTFIHNLLKEREAWIRKHIAKLQRTKAPKINLEDEVLLFGDIYSIDSDEASVLRDKLLKIPTDAALMIVKSYNLFYLEIAQEYLIPRVEYFSKIMSLPYSGLVFKKLKSRWGSCDSKRNIMLNTELLKLKKELIDYVIVHELSHLVHMNHSKEFHAHVEKYLPDARERRKVLKSIRL